MITVNGKEAGIAAGVSVADFLEAQGYDARRVAVGLNGAIVPKAAHGATALRDGDVVDIVNFVSGG
ncbi:MAG: sulfur carrier protein ThiS [Clostridiales Family XIII bacterium]|jgi:sulfur carrier protein|nr:sulfur carrier protein ThiS [Clostridiales Family XIII bacterium]